ncbi:MAG: hypothetical protein ACREEX_15115, partial [Caulobacteraceae bacterium]
VQATRHVYRSYVAVEELMSVVFGALTDPGIATIPFDTAGDAVYEMAEIAELVRSTLGGSLTIERATQEGGEPDRYVGDGTVYTALRQRHDVEPRDFSYQIQQTAEYMNGRVDLLPS